MTHLRPLLAVLVVRGLPHHSHLQLNLVSPGTSRIYLDVCPRTATCELLLHCGHGRSRQVVKRHGDTRSSGTRSSLAKKHRTSLTSIWKISRQKTTFPFG